MSKRVKISSELKVCGVLGLLSLGMIIMAIVMTPRRYQYDTDIRGHKGTWGAYR